MGVEWKSFREAVRMGQAMYGPRAHEGAGPLPGAPAPPLYGNGGSQAYEDIAERNRSEGARRLFLGSARAMVNRQAGFLLLYLLVGNLAALSGVILYRIWLKMTDPGNPILNSTDLLHSGQDQWMGFSYVAMSLSGMAFLALMRHRQMEDPGPYGIFRRTGRKMTPAVFFGAVGLILTAQAISFIYGFGMDRTLGWLGVPTGTGADSAGSGSLAFFIYASFLAPIGEELVFRGAVLGALKPYGKVFAIITTATMFGFFHGVLTQGFFAFMVGLVLGYIACEYSIFWSMALHMCNNFVIAGGLDYLTGFLSGNWLGAAQLAVPVVGILAGLIVLPLARVRICDFIRANRADSAIYSSWRSIWFIVLLLIEGCTALLFILP